MNRKAVFDRLKESDYYLPKPKRRGDWLIFPETAPQNYDLLTCADSVKGVCTENESLEECIEECAESGTCHFGYYIAGPKNYCLPVASFRDPHYNPTSAWGPKSNIPELSGFSVTSFINSKNPYFEDVENISGTIFPDPYTNTVYFEDYLFLRNVETNSRLYTAEDTFSAEMSFLPEIYFSKEKSSVLNINYPNPYNLDLAVESDLTHDQQFALSLGKTGFILRNFGKYIGWILRGNIEIYPEDWIYAKKINKDDSVHVAYGEEFYITYGEPEKGILGLDRDGRLRLYEESYETLKSWGNPVTFVFESDMSVYYCDDKCTEIRQELLEPGNPTATYKGNQVYRSQNCAGFCEMPNTQAALVPKPVLKQNLTSKQSFIYIFLVILVFLYIFLLYRRRG